MDFITVIKTLAPIVIDKITEAIDKKKYGIIHKQAPVKYNGI